MHDMDTMRSTSKPPVPSPGAATEPALNEMGPVLASSTAKAVLALIRNPLDAVPPSIFSEPIVFVRSAGEVKVYIADPALIHEALVKNADVLGKGEQVRRTLGPALGEGLLTADGAHWKW